MQCQSCGAVVPVGSRFCNACGAAVFGPPVFGAPPFDAGAAALPEARRRRPVLLLSLLVALVAAGVAGASLLMIRGYPLLGGKQNEAPAGPALPGSVSANLPEAPPVTSGPDIAIPPGPAVTNARPSGPEMAPGMLLAPGSRPPNAPSVVTAPSPALPNAPAITQAPQPPAPPAPAVTQAPGAPATRPPAPPDHSDLDRYIQWLRFVEQERAGLRALGETQSFRIVEGFYRAAIGLADPDFDERVFDRQLQATLQQTLAAIRQFRANVYRTKPPVPSDCKALDAYYMAAVEQEAKTTEHLLVAMARRDIGAVKAIGGRGIDNIDWNLGQANLQLRKVFEGRGLNPQFEIRTGGNSSLFGGLLGLGGFGAGRP